MSLLESLGVGALEKHWKVVVLSAVFWQAMFVMAGLVSTAMFPAYRSWKKNKQWDWRMRIVSFFNAIIITSVAFPMLFDASLYENKLWGYNQYSGDVNAVVVGYFAWDIYVSILMGDAGFIIHGIAAFSVYFFSFKPFIQYYGAVFIMYELSTPFLNIHWMCDKVGWTGSTLQFVNGILLLAVFFACRLVFGLYQSFNFFVSLYEQFDQIPLHLVVIYSICNFVLNSLNIFWFFKMVDSVHRRFTNKNDLRSETQGGSGLTSTRAKKE
ncbi:TLC domain-containing protein [Chytriomyces cf. hyalinus JEL632]|nr:TLC domain-containing protein [Chytriomyces cf. hyalinus JEL632]